MAKKTHQKPHGRQSSAHVPGSSQLAAFFFFSLSRPPPAAHYLLGLDVMAVSSAASTSPGFQSVCLGYSIHQPPRSPSPALSPTYFPSTAPLPPRQPFFHLHLRLSISFRFFSSSSSLFLFLRVTKETNRKRRE